MSEYDFTFSATAHSGKKLRKTLDGGGYRITLDLDETQFEAMMKLMKLSDDVLLEFGARLPR